MKQEPTTDTQWIADLFKDMTPERLDEIIATGEKVIKEQERDMAMATLLFAPVVALATLN